MTEVIKFFGTKKISDSSCDERLSKNISNLYKNIDKSNLSHVVIPKFLINKKSKISNSIISDFGFPIFIRKIKDDNIIDSGIVLSSSSATATLATMKDDDDVFIQKPLQLPETHNAYSFFRGFLKTLITIDGMYCMYNTTLSQKPQFFINRFHYECDNSELYKTLELDKDIVLSLITVNEQLTYLDIVVGGLSESGKVIKNLFNTDGLDSKSSNLIRSIDSLVKEDPLTQNTLISYLSAATKYPFADIEAGKNNKLFNILSSYNFSDKSQLGEQSDSYILAHLAYSILNTALLRTKKYKNYKPYLFSDWYNGGLPLHTMMNISYNLALKKEDVESANKIINLSNWLNSLYSSIRNGDKEKIKTLFTKSEMSNFMFDENLKDHENNDSSLLKIQNHFQFFSHFFNLSKNCQSHNPTNSLFTNSFLKENSEIKLKNVFELQEEKPSEIKDNYELDFGSSSYIQMRYYNQPANVVRLQTKSVKILKNKIVVTDQKSLERDYEITGNMENIKTVFNDMKYHNASSAANTEKKYVRLVPVGDNLVSEIGGIEIMSIKDYAQMCNTSDANCEIEKEIQLIKNKLQ